VANSPSFEDKAALASFEFVNGIVKSGADGDAIRLSPALVQPIASDDVAAAPLSVSRRVRQVHPGAARGPQNERSVRALLRAVRTIFHR
jgi:hypothetical protein